MNMTIIRDGVPVILIDKHIGDDSLYGNGIMGSDFVRELNMIENSNYAKCEVWINSVGGSVMEGMQIFDAINKSTIEVNTRCVGIAASIAGVIFQAGKKRIMNDYGLLMMHNPWGGDDNSLIAIKESLVVMLSNKCHKTDKQISNMMEKETWLDSSECMEMGFCDEVEITNEERIAKNELKGSFSAYNKLRLVVNKLVETKKVKSMKNLMNALNLTEDASEDSALKEVEALKKQIADLGNSLKEKEEALKAIEAAKLEAENEKKAVELVENAIKENRLAVDAKDAFVALAKTNYDGAKNAIEAIPVKVIANKIPTGGNEPEGRAGWNYRDWETKDPIGLQNMYTQNREQYDLILNKWLNEKKK